MNNGADKPIERGFRMPAEWEPHAATWLTWPRRNGISFPERYDEIPPIYAALVQALVPGESVRINVWDQAMEAEARAAFENAEVPMDRVAFFPFPSYEPWCRDHGPIFVVRQSERAIVDWEYNAWGGKYPPYDLDNEIPRRIADFYGLPRFVPEMVLEGGSIDVNGLGTLLTTESCLLNPNRNAGLTRRQIEQRLHDFLGVSNILWLKQGIEGDDTDGHIDDLTRFVGPNQVVTVIEEDRDDPNYVVLRENANQLSKMRDQDGRPLDVVPLPTPGSVEYQGERLPASYANFYIGNAAVVVPTFRHRNDDRAIDILETVFRDRKVIGIDATALIWGLGAFHCITQQEPSSNFEDLKST